MKRNTPENKNNTREIPENTGISSSPLFTGYRVAECIVCLMVILVGVLYLKTDWISLGFLLPVFFVSFGAIPVLRWLDERARGIRGPALWLSVFVAALPVAVVTAAVTVYFLQN